MKKQGLLGVSAGDFKYFFALKRKRICPGTSKVRVKSSADWGGGCPGKLENSQLQRMSRISEAKSFFSNDERISFPANQRNGLCSRWVEAEEKWVHHASTNPNKKN